MRREETFARKSQQFFQKLHSLEDFIAFEAFFKIWIKKNHSHN